MRVGVEPEGGEVRTALFRRTQYKGWLFETRHNNDVVTHAVKYKINKSSVRELNRKKSVTHPPRKHIII